MQPPGDWQPPAGHGAGSRRRHRAPTSAPFLSVSTRSGKYDVSSLPQTKNAAFRAIRRQQRANSAQCRAKHHPERCAGVDVAAAERPEKRVKLCFPCGSAVPSATTSAGNVSVVQVVAGWKKISSFAKKRLRTEYKESNKEPHWDLYFLPLALQEVLAGLRPLNKNLFFSPTMCRYQQGKDVGINLQTLIISLGTVCFRCINFCWTWWP